MHMWCCSRVFSFCSPDLSFCIALSSKYRNMTWKRSESRECSILTDEEKTQSWPPNKLERKSLRALCRRVDIPHVLQPVNGQQICGHGEVQFVDESGHLGRRIQQIDDGAPQIIQLCLKYNSQPSAGAHRPIWAHVRLGSRTGVTVSFFSAELYCSSERKGSPLGNVSSGDLVAISHTPSYHSSGQRPEDLPESKLKYLHYPRECKECV